MIHKLRGVWKLFSKGYGGYKRQIVVIGLFGLLSGFLEGLGITALIPLFSRLSGEEIGGGVLSGALEGFLGWFDFGLGFKALLFFIVIAFFLKFLVLIASRYVSIRIAADYERKTRHFLIDKTLKSNWLFLLDQKMGYLETILLRDVTASRKLFASIGAIVITIANLFVYVAIAFLISPNITLMSLAVGGVIFLVFKPFLYIMRKLAASAAQTSAEVSRHVNESIIGLKAIKASSVEENIVKKADEHFDLLRYVNIKQNLLKNISSYIVEPISIAFISGVFAFAFVTGTFEIGVFAATMYLIHRIFNNIKSVQASIYNINTSIPHLQRVVDFESEVLKNEDVHSGTKPFGFVESIEFRNVSFSYEGRGKRILSDFNFRVKKGEMIGLIGESGAGKTTMVDMMLRLLEPESGDILVDGIGVGEFDIKDWRKNIGYVSQDIFVMNNTIESNIRFYDEEISEDDIVQATKKAYIYDFIQAQPERLKTPVGERGVLLSGGEKQRLVLARVLAHNPKILILDEATSALDNKSELMIQKAIEDLKGEVTIFVIAHRLSTLLNCDRIIFLDKGKIREQGSPQELLENKNSYFYRLYNIRENTT